MAASRQINTQKGKATTGLGRGAVECSVFGAGCWVLGAGLGFCLGVASSIRPCSSPSGRLLRAAGKLRVILTIMLRGLNVIQFMALQSLQNPPCPCQLVIYARFLDFSG